MISLLGNLSLYIVSFAHLWISPWTKVEESFNLQAAHDLIYEDIADVSNFDHWSFPGVVPRTFIGPLFIAGPSLFLKSLFSIHRFHVQLIVRGTLGFCVISALIRFRSSIRRKFGSTTAVFHLLITLSQFHLLFYSTRTLPNIFALALVLLALSFWLDDAYFKFIFTSGFTILVFRSELILYLGIIVLMDLIVKRISLKKVFLYGLFTLLLSLAFTIIVDSYFWRGFSSLLWPEGEVLRFNVLLNKSSLYGTSPFLWYFYSALPRALFASAPLVLFGSLRDKSLTLLVLPAIAFVLLYSFLPHKELRFIIYVVPVLNVAAAKALHGLWRTRDRSWKNKFLALGLSSHVLLNAGFSLAMAHISSQNYPGGFAMEKLHQSVSSDRGDVVVYINNLAAQTGVSRFTQIHEGKWIYDKSDEAPTNYSSYTHIILEPKEYEASEYVGKHFRRIDVIQSFAGLEYGFSWPPRLALKRKPSLYLLENLNFV